MGLILGHHLPRGGSFFSGDFVLYDQVLESTVGAGFQIFIRFKLGSNPTDGTVNWRGPAGNDDIPIATLPLQWWKDLPVPPNPPNGSSVRRINDQGPDPITSGDMITLDTWFGDGTRDAWLELPPSGQTRENTSTYELAKTADTSVIFARADITLINHRL